VKVILTGEGADELFAGYVGYRFDSLRSGSANSIDPDEAFEAEERQKLWGNRDFFYEKDYYALRSLKADLYGPAAVAQMAKFDPASGPLVNKARLRGRHVVHQRSYVDFKLRLSDHLLADHGDRVAYANSIEARYPFLDIRIVDFARRLPPALKLNDLVEKYIVRQVAHRYLPGAIAAREKFHFVAPGSPALLSQNIEWINDLLSFEKIKRQGYFNPHTVERLKQLYVKPGFKLNLPFDSDLLMIVLTFGIFLDLFGMPDL
jgi:asparagine synthase (glutamine-hydrolysing)